jgi:hypothetical protein
MECLPVDDQARNVRSRHAPPKKDWHVQAAIVDEAELRQLARLVARLTPGQQRFVVALADGFRGGRLEPFQWERAWRAATSAMRACSAMTEPGSLVVQVGASTGETTPADHPAVLALLSPGSLTASRSLRRHLARKV